MSFLRLSQTPLLSVSDLWTPFWRTNVSNHLGLLFDHTQSIVLTRSHSQCQVRSICLDIYLVSADVIPVSQRAWNVDYQGDAARLLERIAISATSDPGIAPHPYTNQISIIQSSGTGKSRAVDELAKSLFTFPFNLRHIEETGSELV